MQALATAYKSYRFRSRLEARWAFFLDQLGVVWEYEPVAYDLGDVRYLPDFWLPEFKVWVEIKGEIRDDQAGLRMIAQCRQLAIQDKRPVILCFRDPFDPICAVFTEQGMYPESRWTTCPTCGGLALGVRDGTFSLVWCPRKHESVPLDAASLSMARRSLYDAAVAARQRQFGIANDVQQGTLF